ncbi:MULTISPECIES: immunity 49 family protein [Corallococcus]|uniref:immunity 49 family protein n=1 Tax=Corallococcus TaxID=83461 RepID=UPI00131551C9|nr:MULTISPECIES: immunity 49 family protein [Corallococcus]
MIRPEGATAQELATLSFAWRILALCSLLQDADTDTFALRLRKSAQARLALLMLAERTSVEPRFLCCSKDLGFGAALAAGDLELATAIAARSPKHHFQGVEYEDDFLFFHLLHRMLLAPEDLDGQARLLGRWRQVEKGQPSAKFELTKALVEKDAGRFPAAFTALLEVRQQKLREYSQRLGFDPELNATEGKVSVDGLAILRLAELHGLPTQSSYDFIPALAQVIPGGPAIPENAWCKP